MEKEEWHAEVKEVERRYNRKESTIMVIPWTSVALIERNLVSEQERRAHICQL